MIFKGLEGLNRFKESAVQLRRLTEREFEDMESAIWPLKEISMNFIPILALVVLCVLSIIYSRAFGGPLGPISGPLDARLSRLWMIKHSWQGDMHRTMIKLHKKHGSLVRTGPNEISVVDLPAIKKIYAAGTKFSKSDWYAVWQGHRKFDLFAGPSLTRFYTGCV